MALLSDTVTPANTGGGTERGLDPNFSLVAETVPDQWLTIQTDLLKWWVLGWPTITFDKRVDAEVEARCRWEQLYG